MRTVLILAAFVQAQGYCSPGGCPAPSVIIYDGPAIQQSVPIPIPSPQKLRPITSTEIMERSKEKEVAPSPPASETEAVNTSSDVEVVMATQTLLDACCRVTTQTGSGSGSIFAQDRDNYYVLTNKHVAGGRGSIVNVQFERDGYPSPLIPAQVVRAELIQGGALDVAILAVAKRHFPFEMPVLKISDGDPMKLGTEITTAGAQAGAWVSLQRGHVTKATEQLYYYWPTALPGRSGSPLIDTETNEIVGLIAWMTGGGNQSLGLAMTAGQLRRWLGQTEASQPFEVSALPVGSEFVPLAPPIDPVQASQAQCNPNSPWCKPGADGQEEPSVPFSGGPWSGNIPPKDRGEAEPKVEPPTRRRKPPRVEKSPRDDGGKAEKKTERLEDRKKKLGERKAARGLLLFFGGLTVAGAFHGVLYAFVIYLFLDKIGAKSIFKSIGGFLSDIAAGFGDAREKRKQEREAPKPGGPVNPPRVN